MNSALLWPLMVAGLLGIHLVNVIYLVGSAASDESFAVEEDYYQRAVQWDAHQAQSGHNQALSWKLHTLVQHGEHGARLEVRVRDAGGAPLVGAQVVVVAFFNARAADKQRLSLFEEEPGVYRTPFTVNNHGLWEFRSTVRRQGEVFTATTRQEVAGP